MTNSEYNILVDKDLRPSYYDDFHCIMGECRYNCCDDPWKIEFSKKDYLTIKQAPKSAEMEELTRRCMHRLREKAYGDYYAAFCPDEKLGRCAFHTPEGLCRLQLECGAETLPAVCQKYPRAKCYLPSGYLERSLSPSCEAVLALLWDLSEGVDFRSDPLPREECQRINLPPEAAMLRWFPVVREWCVDRLQDRRFSLPQRIFLMGLGLKELAEGETDIQRWIERAALLPEVTDLEGTLPSGDQALYTFLFGHLHTLLTIKMGGIYSGIPDELLNHLSRGMALERTTGEEITNHLKVNLAPNVYRNARKRCEEVLGDHDWFMENLMVTVFFHLNFPSILSPEELWKSYVNFCNLYSFYRFLAVMSCREGVEDPQTELFRLMVFASRTLIHNKSRRTDLRDELFKNDSATLAHMAILLCG